MFNPPHSWLLVAGAAVLLAACGAESPSSSPGSGGQSGSGGTGGDALPATLGFDESSALLLTPGETRRVTVVATPPKRYDVRLALQGDYRDGSLSKSEVRTDDSGRASFDLLAPSSATAFTVRASVGDQVFAKLGVSVSANGYGTLEVVPNYAGKRPVSGWVASVRTATTCAELLGNPPEDGDLIGTAGPKDSPLIDFVPVGPSLAVTLRAGGYLSGCKDVSELAAATETKLNVTVTDVPLHTEETDLYLTLSLGEPSTPWKNLLGLTQQSIENELGGPSGDDVSNLLGAMASELDPADAAAFDALRNSEAWDAALYKALGAGATSALRDRAEAWLSQGLQSFTGTMVSGRLVSAGASAPDQAFVELDYFGGVSAEQAGLPAQTQATWSADPGDTVLLGTKPLQFLPSRLLAATALAPAQTEVPGSSSVPAALAASLSCTNVANALVESGNDPNYAHAGCETTCMRALCEAAVKRLWQRARDVSALTAGQTGSWLITATGTATVDDQARPASFDGSWVGSFGVGSSSANLGGNVSGAKPLPPR
ncbi:MAG: hypothetical protein R3B13_28945 [Polyangiaceae bacterium]